MAETNQKRPFRRNTENNWHDLPRGDRYSEIPDQAVLPATLPPEVVSVLKQVLRQKSLDDVFNWVLGKLDKNPHVFELVEIFLIRYEDTVMELKGDMLEKYQTVLFASLLARCLELLPAYQRQFVEYDIDPKFVRTWFEKQILSLLVDQRVDDLDLKIQVQGRRPTEYLDNKLAQLLPGTCLIKMGLFKLNPNQSFRLLTPAY